MRNIVLITWDSVRANHCSCYGYERETTPFLSRLAQRGIKFENAIVSGVPTVPSSFGIVTSEFCPISLPKFDSGALRAIMKKQKTIFKVLSDCGYHTGLYTPHLFFSLYGFAKGCESQYYPESMGKMDKLIRTTFSFIFRRLGLLEKALFVYYFLTGSIEYYKRIENWYDHIVRWIENIEGPYFLWIFLVDTHFPYIPPKEFAYSRRTRRRGLWVQYKKIRRISLVREPKELAEEELRLVIDNYDGEIRHVDAVLKQLWNDLKNTDPILIVHADHGEAFGEHSFFGHPQEHYEYLIRVPLVIYNADVKGVVEEPVSLLRLAPTICELAGVENEFSQPSLLEDVEYTPPIVENKLENGLRVTVRDKEWKLIVNPDREDELYNIKKDPMEQENLIGQEPDIEKELRKLAEKHIKTRREKERLRKRIGRLRGI